MAVGERLEEDKVGGLEPAARKGIDDYAAGGT